MSCCKKPAFKMCEVFVCNGDTTITTPIFVIGNTALNQWRVRLFYKKSMIELPIIDFNNPGGEYIRFTVKNLNKNYCYRFEVSIDGAISDFTINTVAYSSFQFCTKSKKADC